MMMSSVLALCLLTLIGQVVSGADQDLLSGANNAFSQRLYQQIALDKPNVIYSPYSIHFVMTMTSLGARGDTATEMSQALGLTAIADPHNTYRQLITQMNSVTDVKLYTASGIFANPDIPVGQAYIDQVKANYFAQVSNFDLDVPGGPEKEVNDFVDNNTNGMILRILAPGTIKASTAMVLVNTIFFNGTWQRSFMEDDTRRQDFMLPGGAKTQVDMMYDRRWARLNPYANGAAVAEIPYTGGRFSLYIVLPWEVDGITALENVLTQPGKVEDYFQGLTSHIVRLYVPKFKMETKFNLTDVLKQMGIQKAFDPASADFTGISASGGLYISDVIHEAKIEVKETGTVAAAASVVMSVGIGPMMPPPDHVFKADHPFLYFVRDNQAKEILFQGKFSG